MIKTFYLNGTSTIKTTAIVAMHWSARHPWWTRVIAFVLLDALFVLCGHTYAHAVVDDSYQSPALIGGNVTDSSGIPAWYYAMLPIDRGDVFTGQKSVIAFFVDLMWAGHLWAVLAAIALIQGLLTFEWVAWVAAPFNGLAEFLGDSLAQLNWVPFALAISAFVAGIALMAGKIARGVTELITAGVIAVLAVSVLANPVAAVTATGGALDQAQSFGAGLAAAVVEDDTSAMTGPGSDASEVISDAVAVQLVDVFVRLPAMTITFGAPLQGSCAEAFDAAMLTSPPVAFGGNTVRDAVGACDARAKTYVENPTVGLILSMGVTQIGTLALIVLAVALALFLIVTVVFFLIAALKAMAYVFIAITPIGRYGLWKSVADVVAGLVAIVIGTVIVAAYVKFLIWIIEVTGGLFTIVQQMQFVMLGVIVLVVILVRFRARARRAGHTVAEKLASLGFGVAAAKAAPSNKILTMSSLAMTARAFMPAKATAAVGAAERLKPEPKPAVEASPPPLVLGSGAGAGRPTASARPASSATSTSSPSKATHLGELAASAVRVGKAATGGPTTAAAAAAIEVASAAAAWQRNAAQQRAAADGGRRIVVDSSGVGHVERTRPRSTVPPRSTQRGLTASPRASQAREFIANAAR